MRGHLATLAFFPSLYFLLGGWERVYCYAEIVKEAGKDYFKTAICLLHVASSSDALRRRSSKRKELSDKYVHAITRVSGEEV